MAAAGSHVDIETGVKITFYYKTDDLFNKAMIYSNYKAESIKTEQGASMLEEYSLSQDERDLFLVMLEEAVYDCGMRFRKLSHGVTNGVSFNEEIPEIVDSEKYCAFRIVDQKAYNQNLVNFVTQHAEAYIIDYVLYKWYATKNLMELAKYAQSDLQVSRHNLEKSLFQFYKPLINS